MQAIECFVYTSIHHGSTYQSFNNVRETLDDNFRFDIEAGAATKSSTYGGRHLWPVNAFVTMNLSNPFSIAALDSLELLTSRSFFADK